MFGLFKNPSELEKLNKKYKNLMKEYYQLSRIDRKASDLKFAEAEETLQKIEEIN